MCTFTTLSALFECLMAGVARHSQALCAAEAKVAGRTIKESGFGWLFRQVDSLSAVDIIQLFASAALASRRHCVDAWPFAEAIQAAAFSSWRLRRLVGHGQWICGRCWQGCTGSISVSRVCAGCGCRIATFGYI